ncbi:hypothetical protein [Lewinella sp. JB7]|uniref:hypothetical protein n=1 Tax=Lewinella sp. JB7 TaxID=2962887 RepID=UPI0020C9A55C|nr:hypothetical protein [Lewinella sp. JB7]MCP9234530.1 hypothetical protein [Lewinella sp. JB7]
MAIAKKELLIELINSLDSSEKRFFTRYTNQTASANSDKFYRLFRHLSDGGSLDDPGLTRLLDLSGPTQLVNIQRHLYGRILDALRLQHRRRDPGVQVREQIDYANLLYDRGLYLHALKILARAKELAFTYHLDLHHLLIIDFEKTIESRHITRASTERMTSLTTESRKRQEVMSSTVRLSNLQLTLQRHFILHGHVSSAEEARKFYELYHHYFSDPIPVTATFKERILGHQCRFWYYYNQLQLDRAQEHTAQWTAIIEARNELRERDNNSYIKGMDRWLLIAFLRDDAEGHRALYARLQEFVSHTRNTQQQRNSEIMADIVLFRAELDRYLLDADSSCAPAQLQQLGERIGAVTGVDRHKQLVLYYKLAVLHVLNGRHQPALDYLDPILNDRSTLRYDLVVYARLLQLWCHYRLGHTEFVDYGVNNLARYLGRIGYRSNYPALILQLLRGMLRGDEAAARANFVQRVAPLRENVFHLRELRYLDMARLK